MVESVLEAIDCVVGGYEDAAWNSVPSSKLSF